MSDSTRPGAKILLKFLNDKQRLVIEAAVRIARLDHTIHNRARRNGRRRAPSQRGRRIMRSAEQAVNRAESRDVGCRRLNHWWWAALMSVAAVGWTHAATP